MDYYALFKDLKEDEVDYEEEIQWQITYFLPQLDAEYDDAFGKENRQVMIEAPDVESATKMAEQYIRKTSKDDSNWQDAEIISIRRR